MRRRNLIRKEEFPYLIPSGSTYDSGDYHAVLDKALAAIDYPALLKQRDDARRAGSLAGIGISTCLEPNGGNSGFEPLFNPKNDTTTWMDSCLVRVDLSGAITGVMGTSSSGQGHETLVSTVIGEVLEREPADIRVRARRFAAGAAVEQPGGQPHGDHARRCGGRRRAQDQGHADRDRRAQPEVHDRIASNTATAMRRCAGIPSNA